MMTRRHAAAPESMSHLILPRTQVSKEKLLQRHGLMTLSTRAEKLNRCTAAPTTWHVLHLPHWCQASDPGLVAV
jgi:hypothetical protein